MSEYHDKQSRQFLLDYSEVLPIVSELRIREFSMQQIANELNKLGYLTREKKPFSSVQVLRILQRSTQTVAQESTQNAALESQSQSEVDELKIEICTLRTKVEELQQELSDLKSQVTELKQEYQLKKTDIEPLLMAKPARQIDNEMKKVVLQQANELHIENSELSKSEIARLLSERFDVRFETVRDWLKKAW